MHLKKNGHIDATRNKDELRRFCDQFCQFVVDSIQEGLLSRCPFFRVSCFWVFLVCLCVVSVSRPYWANILRAPSLFVCALVLFLCHVLIGPIFACSLSVCALVLFLCHVLIGPINPLHVRGNAANLEDKTRYFYMRIDLNSQKRKYLLFCPPDWLHSYDVQGVYICVFPFCVMYLCLALIVHCAAVSVSVSALVP